MTGMSHCPHYHHHPLFLQRARIEIPTSCKPTSGKYPYQLSHIPHPGVYTVHTHSGPPSYRCRRNGQHSPHLSYGSTPPNPEHLRSAFKMAGVQSLGQSVLTGKTEEALSVLFSHVPCHTPFPPWLFGGQKHSHFLSLLGEDFSQGSFCFAGLMFSSEQILENRNFQNPTLAPSLMCCPV